MKYIFNKSGLLPSLNRQYGNPVFERHISSDVMVLGDEIAGSKMLFITLKKIHILYT